MNKDLWECIDRLEELVGKATQGEWRNGNNTKIYSEYGGMPIPVAKVFSEKDIEYISAANPAMILEMIAEMRRLEKEADWLAEHMQAVCELNPSGICTESCPVSCSCDDFPFLKRYQNDSTATNKKEWREASRKAVSEDDNA